MNDITSLLPRWVIMTLLAGMLFYTGKAASLIHAGMHGTLRGEPAWRMAGYLFAWPGMDFRAWRTRPHDHGYAALPWILGNMLLGATLLWVVARHFTNPLAAGWAGMTGLIFLVHFGVLNLAAVFWRRVGMNVKPIMKNPAGALSLADFWGKRWNLAFRDIAHAFVFLPVARRRGHKAALWASFAVSGLAHELVISVPAGTGYGLPTAYFLLQAVGIILEKQIRPGTAPRRWLFTHAFTALPAFFLFHPPFVERVMLPFFQLIGALP